MRKLAIVLGCLAVMPAWAADPCAELPAAAANYLKANPDWAVIRPADLSRDDQIHWNRHHRDICPGFTNLDLDGSGRSYTALGLIRHGTPNNEEKVVLVRTTVDRLLDGLEVRTLIPEERAYTPLVLFRLPPGKAKEWDSDKIIDIPHDSLGVTWLEASARQFYLENGDFRCAQTSD